MTKPTKPKRIPKTLRGKLARLKLDGEMACKPAREWADNRDPREAWYACDAPYWLWWAVEALFGEDSDNSRLVEQEIDKPWDYWDRATRVEVCNAIRAAVPWRKVRAAAVRRGLIEVKRRTKR